MPPLSADGPGPPKYLRCLRILLKVNFVLLLLAAVLSFLVGWISPAPSAYSLLFAQLHAPEARRIVADLRSRAIPLHLSHGTNGWRIEVPRERARKLRLETCRGLVATEAWDVLGLPLEDPAPAPETSGLRRRATEEELARTLEEMPEVSFAQVQLGDPADVTDAGEATVMIVIHHGCRLSSEDRELVRRLLANSWPGLRAGTVHLIAPGTGSPAADRVV